MAGFFCALVFQCPAGHAGRFAILNPCFDSFGVSTLPSFIPGQRWISETEPELGLGIVLSVEANRVTLLFVAASDRRIYAAQNAPLTRVRFSKGEKIEDQDGISMTVVDILEDQGLLTYIGLDTEGNTHAIEEMELNHFMQFNKPQDRLFTAQLDSSELYSLRQEALGHLNRLDQSMVKGLCGSRTSPIPHQLFIAHEVASRQSPRVLLADEVGLGKTIEAGLIIHRQLLTGHAERVLIVVPEPLLHQWLVEMRRRFNLKFTLFDRERYQESDETNPFLSSQLVLCSLDFLLNHSDHARDVENGQWDLCVVDEAHHLRWSTQKVHREYALVEAISAGSKGLLLLTATPEQLGKESHFARLRLLDPDRFHSYDSFLEEESTYTGLADVIQHVLEDPQLDAGLLRKLNGLLKDDLASELLESLENSESNPARNEVRDKLVQLLLDRHGTGRILFRNTRATIKGFPGRTLIAEALEAPEAFVEGFNSKGTSIEEHLNPELLLQGAPQGQEWWRIDPRVAWLIDKIKHLRPQKVLVICAKAQTVMDLDEALRVANIPAANFHEGLSIIARDRAAAWFADEEDGAQALICSEIGSEGRNFQFAHHLILFDLPFNPDLLEQRIGRLDRIGQTETIKIHVNYFKETPQAHLFDWYHQGLNAFESLNPAAQAVFSQMQTELQTVLTSQLHSEAQALIQKTRALSDQIEAQLHQGRDRLLEINSCRTESALALLSALSAQDEDATLWPFLERVFDAYGIAVEEHSQNAFILRPGEHMRMQFPEIPDEGVTVTLDRNLALAREDLLFLSWEHPLVLGAIDIILNSEHGNACLSVVRHEDLDPGQLLVECIHVIESPGARDLQLGRFSPARQIRTLLDSAGEDLSHLDLGGFQAVHQQFDREHAVELLRSQRKPIERSIQRADSKIKGLIPKQIEEGTKRMLDSMTNELKRLAALRKVNPNVRQDELDQLKSKALEMHAAIQATRHRLDAVRVIITA